MVDRILCAERRVSFFGWTKATTAGQFNAKTTTVGDVNGAFAFMWGLHAAGRLDVHPTGGARHAAIAATGRIGTAVKGGGRAVKTHCVTGSDHDALAEAPAPLAGTCRVGQIHFFPEDQW